MNSSRTQWLILGLVAAAAVLATLLAVTLYHGSTPPYAIAEVSEGAASYVVGILGPPRETRVPLFLIDTKNQVILTYEYDQSRRLFFLRTARTFRDDRLLEDSGFDRYGVNEGPTVKDVQKIVRDLEKKGNR
jgi:hypothetical protein